MGVIVNDEENEDNQMNTENSSRIVGPKGNAEEPLEELVSLSLKFDKDQFCENISKNDDSAE